MKNLHRIVFVLFALISVGLMAWAIAVGASAPESSKIANATPLAQQFDEEGNALNTEEGLPLPVQSTAEGIDALATVFANQYKTSDDGVLYGEALEEAKVKKEENLKVIPELEAKVAELQAGYDEAAAKVKELEAVKYKSGAQRKALEEAQKVVAEYTKVADELKQRKDNDEAWTENIPASEAAIAKATEEAESMRALAQAINVNLLWGYFLLVFAIAFVVLGAILNFFQSRGGLMKTVVSLVVVVVVVGIAYALAVSNGWLDGNVLYDVKGYPLGIGTDPATRTVFGAFEYMTADVCILVAYFAFVGAALAAIYSAVRGIFKS